MTGLASGAALVAISTEEEEVDDVTAGIIITGPATEVAVTPEEAVGAILAMVPEVVDITIAPEAEDATIAPEAEGATIAPGEKKVDKMRQGL